MTKEEMAEFEHSINQDEIDDDDYGFVIDSTGKLKSVFYPANAPFKPPKNIAPQIPRPPFQILKISTKFLPSPKYFS